MAAKRLQERLTGVDPEFKSYHLSIVAVLEQEEYLATKEAAMDNHDDRVTGLFTHLMTLTTAVMHQVKGDPHQYRWQLKVVAKVFMVADRYPEGDCCLLNDMISK